MFVVNMHCCNSLIDDSSALWRGAYQPGQRCQRMEETPSIRASCSQLLSRSVAQSLSRSVAVAQSLSRPIAGRRSVMESHRPPACEEADWLVRSVANCCCTARRRSCSRAAAGLTGRPATPPTLPAPPAPLARTAEGAPEARLLRSRPGPCTIIRPPTLMDLPPAAAPPWLLPPPGPLLSCPTDAPITSLARAAAAGDAVPSRWIGVRPPARAGAGPSLSSSRRCCCCCCCCCCGCGGGGGCGCGG